MKEKLCSSEKKTQQHPFSFDGNNSLALLADSSIQGNMTSSDFRGTCIRHSLEACGELEDTLHEEIVAFDVPWGQERKRRQSR